MHKIAESNFATYFYLITDICLGYLRVGKGRILEKIGWGGGGGGGIRGKTKTVLAACVIHPID